MASFPIPKRLANERVVQCVEVSSGDSWQVTRTISATVPSGRAGLRPRPFAITPTPSAPLSANRARHRRTESESTSHRRAISWLAKPWAAHNKAFACTTVRCGNVVDAAIFCNWARCVWVTDTAGALITAMVQRLRHQFQNRAREHRKYELPTGLLNPLIVFADDREQLDQVLTHGVALVPFARANDIDQTHEGVLNIDTLNVQIGHQHLGGDVGRGRGCGNAGSLLVDTGGALHQLDLSQANGGLLVSRALRQRPGVGIDRCVKIVALDRVEGLLMQRRQLRLDLRLRLLGRRDGSSSGHAVLGSELEQLVAVHAHLPSRDRK